jgi:hypothetical protein
MGFDRKLYRATSSPTLTRRTGCSCKLSRRGGVGPPPIDMRIVTLNVNGIRSAER